MQSGFVKAICQMGIFMICAQTIVHFRPKASYEKYLKMLVSAMILIQLLVSIGSFFSSEGKKDLMERAGWFAQNLEENMQNAMKNSVLGESMYPDIMGEVPFEGENPAEQGDENIQNIRIEKITVEVAPVIPVRGQTEDEDKGSETSTELAEEGQ